MSKADEVTMALVPLARDGNPEAARALCRMMVADDPDLAAQEIIEETAALVHLTYDILRPVLDLVASR